MNDAPPRFIFAGHAVGVAAQFHRLDEISNLNHSIPTLGASVLSVTGGLSKSHVSNFCFEVDHPRRRKLVSVRHIDTNAEGRTLPDKFETEVESEIRSVGIVEKLHIDRVRVHVLATRTNTGDPAVITTKGNRIEGLHLGSVEATVELDDEPLCFSANKAQLADFYRRQSAAYRAQHAWRFHAAPEALEIPEAKGRCRLSLVHKITLSGRQDPEHPVEVDEVERNVIHWKGFGRIFLGEVLVAADSRRVTLVRLAMGSDAGGSSSIGEGESNGQIET